VLSENPDSAYGEITRFFKEISSNHHLSGVYKTVGFATGPDLFDLSPHFDRQIPPPTFQLKFFK